MSTSFAEGQRAHPPADSRHDAATRCRLILTAAGQPAIGDTIIRALGGGDVAAVILRTGSLAETGFQQLAEQLMPAIAAAGAMLILEDDTQAMGRSGADGLYIAKNLDRLKDAVARFSPKRIIGYGGARSRHAAMEAGEAKADFLFLGDLEGDIRPEPHPKNLVLGEWCAEVMQLPVAVMGGSALESALTVAECGVDFVAMGRAVFAHPDGPEAAVARINDLLEEKAPRFEDV